jgi:primary-amine oxidase
MRHRLTTAASLALALGAAAAGAHPLDGLTADELRRVTEILRAAGEADEATLFPLVELVEPPKAEVLAWDGGPAPDRKALAQFTSAEGFRSAVVNITAGAVESAVPAGGQPMILFDEFLNAMGIALAAPEMVAGLAARGLTPQDVFCLPLTAGTVGAPEEAGRRLMKAPCYLNPTGSNFYARPVEGLFATIDLATGEVIRVVDEGAVPPPQDAWGYTMEEAAARAPLRPETTPATLSQPGGSNVAIDGSAVEWDIWRFRWRVDKRPGVVLSNIDVRDGERWRSVLYQAHLSEVFVPYMDPGEGWWWRTYMDSGEYGFGLFLSPLARGIDCPAHAAFFPAIVNDDAGAPLEIPDAICIFERDVGDPAWRHFEVFAQTPETFVPAEGRPASELILRSASQVGNYDYLIDYRFKQNGEIAVMIGATGIDGVKGVAATSMDDPTAAEDTRHGTLIAPHLVAPFHDHYFNFRFDFDVDQPVNHVAALEIVPLEDVGEGPRTSFWTLRETAPDSELDARFRLSATEPRYLQVMNMDAKGPLGHHPGYMIHHGSVAYGPFDVAGDAPFRRNAYVDYSVWTTVQDDAQRYAGGTYALQSDGSDTLAEWVKADRSLAEADVVTWFTAGFHHIPRTEDWPVMSTDWKTIHIMPMNFFAHNPALTLRRPE